jgi:hypothetical protein
MATDFYLGSPTIRIQAEFTEDYIDNALYVRIYNDIAGWSHNFIKWQPAVAVTTHEFSVPQTLGTTSGLKNIRLEVVAFVHDGVTATIHSIDLKIPPLVATPLLSMSSATTLSVRGRSARRTSHARSRMSP